MTSFKRRLLIKVYDIFDISALACAFVMATLFTAIGESHSIRLSEFLSMRIKIQNLLIIGVVFTSWLFIFNLVGIHRSRRIGKISREILDIFKATTIATSVLLMTGFIFNIIIINTNFLVIFWGVSSLLLISSRIILRITLKKARLKGHNLRQMIIVGTGERSIKFAEKICRSPELGYHIAGFVDDQWEGLEKFNGNGWKLLGNLEDFQEVIKNQVIDEVVISLPVKSHYEKIGTIIKLCEEQGILVRLLSDLFDLKIAKSYVDYLDDTPILTLHSTPIEQWPHLVKKFVDVAVSLVLLVLLSPFFILIAILIKCDSKGSVFFIQERVGYNKRKFKLIKFRTMIQDAEVKQNELEYQNEATGPVFKIKNDPRFTRVGKWLRRLSLDELPQLINVLKGEMSLVGPRPLPLRDYRGFDQNWHRRRFSVRPGITCLWQVNGRSNTPFEEWMELDMEYIDNWSLGLDVKILAKTIPAVIRGTGAA